MDQDLRINFSGVVVCYNEAELLGQCLEALGFCQELIVVDLGSTDGAQQVAERCGVKVLPHEHVPIRNKPLHYGIARAKYEWVIAIDPDELFPKDDIIKIEKIIKKHHDIAGIRLPWQHYFRGKALHHTAWGRSNATKCVVVHRDRIKGSALVHREFTADQNIYVCSKVDKISPIKHYWIDSYRELFVRQWRYAKLEGEAKYTAGQRFSWVNLFKYTAADLYKNLIKYQGLWGGFTGIFLSFYHAWYVFMGWLSLRKYERQLEAGKICS